MKKTVLIVILISVLIFIIDFFTLINQSFPVGQFWRKVGEFIGFGSLLIFVLSFFCLFVLWFINLFKRSKESDPKTIKPEARPKTEKEQRIASPAETIIRRFFGFILLIATIPFFLNILTLPTIIIFLTFAVYCLKSQRYRLGPEIFWVLVALLIYFVPITPLAWGVFPGLKATRLSPSLDTSTIANYFFYIFTTAPIIFSSLAFFLLANDITSRVKRIAWSSWRNILPLIFFVAAVSSFVLSPFVSKIVIEPGYGSFARGGSGGGIEKGGSPELKFDPQQNLWSYNFRMKNNSPDTADIEKIYGDKAEILLLVGKNIEIEGASFENGKILIKPGQEARITILSQKPFGIITFRGENTGVFYDFWK